MRESENEKERERVYVHVCSERPVGVDPGSLPVCHSGGQRSVDGLADI